MIYNAFNIIIPLSIFFLIRIDNESGTLNIISSQDVNSSPISNIENLAATHLIYPNHYSTQLSPSCGADGK